jgi:hypothetical protein
MQINIYIYIYIKLYTHVSQIVRFVIPEELKYNPKKKNRFLETNGAKFVLMGSICEHD